MTAHNADDIEQWCEVMHDAYETEAVKQGWQTNPRSAVPWDDVPEANKATMRAAVGAVSDRIANRALNDAADEIDAIAGETASTEVNQAVEIVLNVLRARAADQGEPTKPYQCAGCGERFDTYAEANGEGRMHDHWTEDGTRHLRAADQGETP